jgi:hypothetical protein
MKLSQLALSYRLKVRVLGNEFSTDSGYKERGGRKTACSLEWVSLETSLSRVSTVGKNIP